METEHLEGISMASAPGDEANPIRVCVIDLGTNSFHALVIDAFPNRSFKVVDKVKESVDLGEHGLTQHILTEDAVQRAIRALNRIRMVADGWKAEEYLAYATSAIREAENGGDFLEFVREEVGIDVRPISGPFEAHLIYQGVRRAVELPGAALLVDIGGGSTEFIVADASGSFFETSLKLGAARMTDEFITTDPVSEQELERLRSHFRETLAAVFAAAREHGVREIVASSGTLENLAEVCRTRGDRDRSIYQQAFEAASFQDVVRAVIASPRADRAAMVGIEEKRLDQIVAGAVLTDVLIAELGIERIRISPNALREGMVVHFIEENYERLERLAPLGDVRRRQVIELADRFGWDEDHSRHVASLALTLFDACRDVHELGDAERELLEYAALLHDIGYSISRKQHHKHSRYLIRKADWHEFQPDEIAIMAMLARYHRGALPKKKHRVYGELSKEHRRVVDRLAALLRIAEGLDRSHFQNVTDIEVQADASKLKITVRTKGDPEMEVWGARRAADLFERTFDRQVVVSAAWQRRG